MALGTPTILSMSKYSGDTGFIKLQFAGDSAYTTNGTAAFTAYVETAIKTAAGIATDLVTGPSNITILEVIPGECGIYRPCYDFANDKLKVRFVEGPATITEPDATSEATVYALANALKAALNAINGPDQELGSVDIHTTTFNVTVIYK